MFLPPTWIAYWLNLVLWSAFLIGVIVKRVRERRRKTKCHPRRRRRIILVAFFRAGMKGAAVSVPVVVVSPGQFSQLKEQWEGVILNMAPTAIAPPVGAISQIFANDPNGVNLIILEAGDDGVVIPASGPFAVAVTDPNSLVTVTPGSADNSTPTNIKPNGSGNTGTVSVIVTDTTTGLVSAAAVLNIAAPVTPPPPTPTQIAAFFISATPSATSAVK